MKTIIMSLDLTSDIAAYESGELNDEQVIALFQNLLDSGLIFVLQGSYQRVCQQLLNAGLIERN